jgi:hypothetical protein
VEMLEVIMRLFNEEIGLWLQGPVISFAGSSAFFRVNQGILWTTYYYVYARVFTMSVVLLLPIYCSV